MTAPGNAERPENVRLILAAGQELPVTVDYVGNMTWRSVVSDPNSPEPSATRVVIEGQRAELEQLRARVAELEGEADPKERERRARAEALRRCRDEGHDDDGHGPWHYMEFGVACSCGCAVDRDEMCTRARTPDGIREVHVAALFETADNLLTERRRGTVPDGCLDDLQSCVDALTVNDPSGVS